MNTIKISEYIQKIRNALKFTGAHQFYFPMNKEERKRGTLRLAREIGYGFSSYSKEEINEIIGSTYGILVISNCLDSVGVQIDNKMWIENIYLGMK